MVAKRSDYTVEAVEAARSVLLELSRLLGEYQDSVVVVGGWVPELLISQAPHQHVGSIDVDIALDHRKLKEVGYKTILQLLLARGYQPSEQLFIFFRTVQLGEQTFDVEVDFLAGEYSGSTRGHRTQKVQDMRPRKARGCDLAVSLATEVTLSAHAEGLSKGVLTVRTPALPLIQLREMTAFWDFDLTLRRLARKNEAPFPFDHGGF
jgi:hypothetical protein